METDTGRTEHADGKPRCRGSGYWRGLLGWLAWKWNEYQIQRLMQRIRRNDERLRARWEKARRRAQP